MESLSNIESPAARFAPYVEDLQGFFTRREVPFGSPEDIAPFAAAVSAPGPLHEAMSSMVRSIIYRENKAINVVELLELLMVAVGGAQVDQAAQHLENGGPQAQNLQEPSRQLLAFVREVYASLRNPVASGPSVIQKPAPAREPEGTPPAITNGGSSTGAAAEAALLAAAPSGSPRPGPSNMPSPDLPSQNGSGPVASTANGTAANVADGIHAFQVSTSRHRTQAGPAAPTAVRGPDAVPASGAGRLRLWIAVSCAGFLVLLVALLLRQHASVQPSETKTPGRHATVTPPAALTAKPSPYGTTIGGTRSTNGGVSTRGSNSFGSSSANPTQPGNTTAPLNPDTSAQPSAVSPSTGEGEVTQSTPTPSAAATETPPSSAARGAYPQPGAAPGTAAQPTATEGNAASAVPSRSVRPTRSFRAVPYTSRGLFNVSSGIMAANLLSAPPPEYPKLAEFAHIQGQVIVQAVVSRNGTVVVTHVLRGHRLLRGAATHAVRRWRYRPFILNGHPTDVSTIITVDFQLHH